MKSIMSLRPDTRTLAVITGSGFLDRTMDQAVRRGLAGGEGEFFDRVLRFPPPGEGARNGRQPDAPNRYPVYEFQRRPGWKNLPHLPEVVRKISKAANAPVFGLLDTLLENGGIVGGVMLTHRGEASRAVQLSLEILRWRAPGRAHHDIPRSIRPHLRLGTVATLGTERGETAGRKHRPESPPDFVGRV